jgi:hypothetical protein
MLRRVIGVETLQNIDLDELVQIVAPTIERYLTADLSALN